MSINSVTFTGRLGKEPEVRATQSGTSVMSLWVCVNGRKKDSSGEWQDDPSWVDCIVFGSRADGLRKILHKGSFVAVRGHLHENRWEDKGGGKRRNLEVVADDVDPGPKLEGSKPAPADDYYDDDCPF